MNMTPREIEESLEDLQKGAYDPDAHGFWGEHEATCSLRVGGGAGSGCDCSYSQEVEHEATDTR
jgi:hypothetical protein